MIRARCLLSWNRRISTTAISMVLLDRARGRNRRNVRGVGAVCIVVRRIRCGNYTRRLDTIRAGGESRGRRRGGGDRSRR